MIRFSAALLALALTSSLVASGVPIAPAAMGSSPYVASFPQVAFARGRFLTVWSESLDPAHARIVGAFSDARGHRIARVPFIIRTSGEAAQLELLATGEGFLLFEFPSEDFPRMQVLDENGTLQTTHTVEVRTTTRPAIAWNGREVLIVANTGAGGYAVRVSAEGKTLSSKRLQSSVAGAAAVPLTDGFLVLFASEGGLSSARVAADGKIAILPLAPNPTAAIAATPLSGGDTAIAWADVADAKLLIHRGVLRSDGTLANSEIVTTTTSPVYGLSVTPRSILLSDWTALRHFTRTDAVTIDLPEILQPEIAWGGDVTLLVRVSAGFVRTVAIDAKGIAQPSEALSFAFARQTAPVLGSAGTTALALWTEQSATSTSVRAAALHPNGEPFAPFVIAAGGYPAATNLAWNGSEYLAVLLSGPNWIAQRISRWGAPVGDPIVLGPFRPEMKAATTATWAGDRWVVIHSEDARAFFTTVLPNGVLGDKRELSLPAVYDLPTLGVVRLAAAFEDERGVVAWTELFGEASNDGYAVSAAIFAVRITRDGEVLGAPRTISGIHDSGFDLAIASNGSEVAIVHDRFLSFHADFVRFDGSAASPPVTLNHGSASDFGVGVVWDGNRFIAALRWSPTRILLHRLGTSAFSAVETGAALQGGISLVPTLPGHFLIGVQEISPDGPHAVTYSDDDATVVRRRPSQP